MGGWVGERVDGCVGGWTGAWVGGWVGGSGNRICERLPPKDWHVAEQKAKHRLRTPIELDNGVGLDNTNPDSPVIQGRLRVITTYMFRRMDRTFMPTLLDPNGNSRWPDVVQLPPGLGQPPVSIHQGAGAPRRSPTCACLCGDTVHRHVPWRG